MTYASGTQNDDAQPRHERLCETARRLLADADADAAVLADCQATLSSPGYQRSHAQAALDACSVLLALADADIDTRRTREARQLLQDVQRGQHV